MLKLPDYNVLFVVVVVVVVAAAVTVAVVVVVVRIVSQVAMEHPERLAAQTAVTAK